MYEKEDVIAAIATPIGEGGIAIIRMSGYDSYEIIKKIFKSKNKNVNDLKSHTQYFGTVYNPKTEEIIDEVLVSYMKEPRSYTKENVVEIHSHGGIVVANKILKLVCNYGAKFAEPGEFTKRAFLNGRIDLSQAESVIDIIKAKTEKGLDIALKQLKGELKDLINIIRKNLLEILASIEADIDFPEDEIDTLNDNEIKEKLLEIRCDLEKLIDEFEKGRILREGLKVVIVGRTNVGKSSLLNALLREKRAIVTNIPGTTRDVIEEYINVKGIPLKIIDTAGIRETSDEVEKIGVEQSKRLLEKCDLILYVLDASEKIQDDEKKLLKDLSKKDKKVLIIINKIDLQNIKINKNDINFLNNKYNIIEISAKERKGVIKIEETVEKMVLEGKIYSNKNILITKERQKDIIEKSLKSINDAVNTLENGLTGEFLSIDIKNTWENLGKITGETIEEDILDKIFSDFCIGK